MYYLKANFIEKVDNQVILEANNIGYIGKFYDRCEDFLMLDKYYLLHYNNEFESTYYFSLKPKYILLLKILLDIKGVGVKIIDLILTEYSYDEFLLICKNYEIEKLMQLSLISKDISIKIVENVNKLFYPIKVTLRLKNCITSLQKMGYKYSSIYQTIPKVDQKQKYADLLKDIILKINEANKQQI